MPAKERAELIFDLDFFEILRGLAVIAGLIYQGRILRARLKERIALADPEAKGTKTECEVLDWHLERGWLLMVAHSILLIVAVITHSTRAAIPIESHDINFLRAAIDLLWTALVFSLAAISYRANIHYDRLIGLIEAEKIDAMLLAANLRSADRTEDQAEWKRLHE